MRRLASSPAPAPALVLALGLGALVVAPRPAAPDAAAAPAAALEDPCVEGTEARCRRRALDLLIIMLGNNEATWLPAKGAALDEHERMVTTLAAVAHASNPDRACLVISPFDQLAWEVEGTPPRPSIAPMVAAQRRAALAAGCAFWDAYQWMGGRGSARQWRRRKLLTNDFVHPTPAGSRRIGEALAAGLLDGYRAWRARTGAAAAPAKGAT